MSQVTAGEQVQQSWWESLSSGLDSVLGIGAKYAEIAQSLKLRDQAIAGAVSRATPEFSTNPGANPADPFAHLVLVEPQNVAQQAQRSPTEVVNIGGVSLSGTQLALIGLGAVALYLAVR